MITLSDMKKWYKDDHLILFILTEEDAQTKAKEKIGRELTSDEMRLVAKGVESGLECWDEVMGYAIDEAVGK